MNATIISPQVSNQYNIDEKLNQLDIDIGKINQKIVSLDKQIDEIEVDFLRENTSIVFGHEYLVHLKRREETLRNQKSEYRKDLDSLRMKEHQLLELKIINQYSKLPREGSQIIQMIRARLDSNSQKLKSHADTTLRYNELEAFKDKNDVSYKKPIKSTNDEFQKIVNSLSEKQNGSTINKVMNSPISTKIDSSKIIPSKMKSIEVLNSPNYKIVSRTPSSSFFNDLFDVNTGLDIYDKILTFDGEL